MSHFKKKKTQQVSPKYLLKKIPAKPTRAADKSWTSVYTLCVPTSSLSQQTLLENLNILINYGLKDNVSLFALYIYNS